MRREHLVAAAVVATVVLAATSLGSGGPSPFVDDGGASSTDDRRMIVDDAHDPATTLEASESGKQTIEDRTPLGALARSRHRQLTDDELAILRDLEPEAFRAVPPAGGTWDQTSKNPCFFVQAKVDNRECMPYYHVVGAWQSGGRALNAKISMHPDVFQSGETHFWNEDRPMRAYLDRYDAFERAARARQNQRSRLIVGDDSPGVLANTWTESQRLHRAFKDTVATCWKACQALPETVPHGAPAGSPTERRRCVDGDAENNILGCGAEAAKADPPREKPGGHALSVPHLMRAVYGDRDVKIIAVLREPVARLHAAYSHYEHYAKRFGDGAAGFDEFVNLFVDAFEECAGEHGVEGCAHRFEAYHPKYEAVFYHADQLIKTMYATFLEGWLAMFGAENVLALRTEDVYHSDPAVRKTQLKKALDHLGLGDVADDAMLDAMDACDEECNADDAAMATKTFTVDQVRPSTREKLDAFFKPQLADLAAMLGDDKWRWPEYVGG
mmetsp:Transcript_7436/g.30108  ORF Transcript_7436/g.30108 Transcript_7436/m.30108 type:complete len:499 (-) Transcript_7436:100-1596(-)